MIVANRVPIEDDEIMDYIVDGIPDRHLEDQARIMRFKSQSDLLEAFKGLPPYSKKPADHESKKFVNQEQKKQKERKTTGENPTSPKKNPTLSESPRRRVIKCYNCRETGHRASACPQPKETKNSVITVVQSAIYKRIAPKKRNRRHQHQPTQRRKQ